MTTGEHDQNITHHYQIHYPEHSPRESDPHYKDFNAYHRRTHATAKCSFGQHHDDYTECLGVLELHHAHVEFALQNGIELAWLERDYPGIGDADSVGAWVESAANLMWLCAFHHRGHGGVHVASASDFEASRYVRGLIS
jgi:hypothetical protein